MCTCTYSKLASNFRKKLKTERVAKKSPGIPSKPRRKAPNKLEKKSTVKSETVTNLLAEEAMISKQEQSAKTGHMTPEEVVRHLESRRSAELFSFSI